MSPFGWVEAAVAVIFLLATGLTLVRQYSLLSTWGKPFGVVYVVVMVLLAGLIGVGGVLWLKRQQSEVMAER